MNWSGADWIELGLSALLMALAWISKPYLEPWGRRAAEQTRWCMLALAVAPVALRLILLPKHPEPTPQVYDEFAHLLVADTLRHFRLANPMHPMHQFFETFFTLQDPAYSSIYPIGQGSVMAIGRAIFGTPWAGVLMGIGALSALCYWMLRAWTTPLWSLIGGVLAVIEFGPLSQWTNSYWGGSAAACAGCLAFGALPRLKSAPRTRDAILLGAGLGLHLLTRPYESIVLLLSVSLFYAPWKKVPLKAATIAAFAVVPAIVLVLAQNKSVTGHWLMLPYQLSQQQYGVPTSMTFQTAPAPHRQLTPQQALEYRSQMSYRDRNGESLQSYLLRLEYRVRYYRFFFLPALYLTLPFFFIALREYRFVWVALTLLLFILGANFYPFFYPHYIAALTCLFVLVSVTGLRQLCRLRLSTGREAAWMVLALCGAHFLLWYGVNLFDVQALLPYETWDQVTPAGQDRRTEVIDALKDEPGEQLVFVRYSPRHVFQQEWVYNAADIDAARIVWARDLGPEQDEQLLHYYPDRKAWLLDPDTQPPDLTPYR